MQTPTQIGAFALGCPKKIQIFWRSAAALCISLCLDTGVLAQDSVGNIVTGSAKISEMRRYGTPQALPMMPIVSLDAFVAPVDAIVNDESAAARLHNRKMQRRGVDENSTPQILAQHVQGDLSESFEKELKKANIPFESSAAPSRQADQPEVIVSGEFTSINEGNKSKRIMIGLGRGASSIKAHVRISLAAKGASQLLLEFDVTSESGDAPGDVVTMGFAPLASGAIVGAVGDNASTVEADAARVGTLVAKQIVTLMKEPGFVVAAHP